MGKLRLFPSKRDIGFAAERAALKYLKQQKLTLITKNFACKMGEIDLIMRDQDTLTFVEVRLRNHPGYGSGIESVNFQKQRKIKLTADFYLQKHALTGKVPCRFDIVSVKQQEKIWQFDWVKNAFR